MNRSPRPRRLVVLVLSMLLVAATACGDRAVETTGTLDVKGGQDATLTSPDKQVIVTVPGKSIRGEGQLTLSKVAGETDGYSIRIGNGAKLAGEATIAFKAPTKSAAPVPLVSFTTKQEGALTPVAETKLANGYAKVTTTHFSNWFVTWWDDVLEHSRGLVDRIYSADREGKAPKCGDEDAARDAGYKVTSSKGGRVLWCMGIEDNRTVLKVVNARGYAVAVEHSPNTKRIDKSNDDFVTAIANVLPVAPYKRGNETFVVASGDSATFVVPKSGDAAFRVYPDGSAYLVSALAFATETVTLVLDRTGLSRNQQAILKAFDIQQCVASFHSGATGHIENVAESGKYLESALTGMLGCAKLAVKNLDLGFFAGPIAAGIVWLIGGVRNVVNGIGGSLDTILNPDGYRIATRGPAESFSRNPDEWPSGPGFIGPIQVGANVHDLIDDGWAARSINVDYCDFKWQLSDSLYPRGFSGEFRDGDSDTLDGLTIGGTTLSGGEPVGRYKTAEGIGLGSTTKQVRAAYKDVVHGEWAIEGGAFVGYVRSTPQGSIMFNVGNPGGPDFGMGDGSHVTYIVVTADTSTDAFSPPVGGC